MTVDYIHKGQPNHSWCLILYSPAREKTILSILRQNTNSAQQQNTAELNFKMSTSQLKNLLLPAIFIFNLTKSTVVQVSRKTQNNAALDILPYFLESTALNSLQRHGCWCAKLLDPEIDLKGKRETSDELDGICKKWQMSANCVHSMGGACDNYKIG